MHPFKSLAANLDLMFTSRNENKPNEALLKMFFCDLLQIKIYKKEDPCNGNLSACFFVFSSCLSSHSDP